MFDDLISLFDGWYTSFVSSVSSLFFTEVTLDANDDIISSVSKSPDVWSCYVPWEQIIAAVVLITFTICIFKFLRTILCKIL